MEKQAVLGGGIFAKDKTEKTLCPTRGHGCSTKALSDAEVVLVGRSFEDREVSDLFRYRLGNRCFPVLGGRGRRLLPLPLLPRCCGRLEGMQLEVH